MPTVDTRTGCDLAPFREGMKAEEKCGMLRKLSHVLVVPRGMGEKGERGMQLGRGGSRSLSRKSTDRTGKVGFGIDKIAL